MITSKGIKPDEREQVATLYWEAFGPKLARVMHLEPKAMAFIEKVLDPEHAICAHDREGKLLGVAGFKTYEGALVNGTFEQLSQAYGPFGAVWRAALLSLLERDTEDARFLMDGIFVEHTARGQGVGTTLLKAIVTEAHRRGFGEVRLDVIDANTRARALYERFGFVPKHTQNMGLLRHIFGFKSATTMIYQV